MNVGEYAFTDDQVEGDAWESTDTFFNISMMYQAEISHEIELGEW